MTILILLLLVIALITFVIFFGIFKLIWILCQSKRNTWPLLLAGICTLALAAIVTLGLWLGVRRIMEPFQSMRASIKNNPQQIYGQHTYKEGLAPYSLTLVDGMDFSDWIHFDETSVKLGIDTNMFKKADKSKESTYLAGAIVRRNHPKEESFLEAWKSIKNSDDAKNRLQILSEEEVMVNGMPAHLINGIGHTNRGPLPFWLQVVEAEPEVTYYLLLSPLGTEDKTEQIKRVLQSFRSSRLPIATPESLPTPAETTQEPPVDTVQP